MPATTAPPAAHRARELREGGLEVREVAVRVEVLEIDVRDDRDVGRERMERAVVFVRLGDDDPAAAEPEVRAAAAERAADDHRRIEPRGREDRARHRRRGRLAVRARDRDAALRAHQRAEEVRAAHERDAGGHGRGELGVVGADRGGNDDRIRPADVARVMADRDADAGRAQVARRVALEQVGAADGPPFAREQLGERAHPRAADADEVQGTSLDDVHARAAAAPAGPSRKRAHELLEHLAAVLEVPELVERRARGAEQDGVALRSRTSCGLRDGRLERAGRHERRRRAAERRARSRPARPPIARTAAPSARRAARAGRSRRPSSCRRGSGARGRRACPRGSSASRRRSCPSSRSTTRRRGPCARGRGGGGEARKSRNARDRGLGCDAERSVAASAASAFSSLWAPASRRSERAARRTGRLPSVARRSPSRSQAPRAGRAARENSIRRAASASARDVRRVRVERPRSGRASGARRSAPWPRRSRRATRGGRGGRA